MRTLHTLTSYCALAPPPPPERSLSISFRLNSKAIGRIATRQFFRDINFPFLFHSFPRNVFFTPLGCSAARMEMDEQRMEKKYKSRQSLIWCVYLCVCVPFCICILQCRCTRWLVSFAKPFFQLFNNPNHDRFVECEWSLHFIPHFLLPSRHLLSLLSRSLSITCWERGKLYRFTCDLYLTHSVSRFALVHLGAQRRKLFRFPFICSQQQTTFTYVLSLYFDEWNVTETEPL